MAINKRGFNFYNCDTDRYQDRRIKRLKKDFGCVGVAIYDYLLCEIYRVEGCYLVWDDNLCFDVSEYWSIKENTVKEVVRYCGVVGLFDKELLTRGIITSLSIQKRYIEMCRRAKRQNPIIPPEISVLGIAPQIPEKPPILPEESKKIPEVEPQSKVEYRKEENTPSIPLRDDRGEEGFINLKQTNMENNTPTHNLPALIRRLEKLKIKPDEINKICELSDNGLIGHAVWKILIKTEGSPKLHSPGRFIISQLNSRNESKG